MVAQAEFGLDSPKKLYLSSLDLGVSQPKEVALRREPDERNSDFMRHQFWLRLL